MPQQLCLTHGGELIRRGVPRGSITAALTSGRGDDECLHALGAALRESPSEPQRFIVGVGQNGHEAQIVPSVLLRVNGGERQSPDPLGYEPVADVATIRKRRRNGLRHLGAATPCGQDCPAHVTVDLKQRTGRAREKADPTILRSCPYLYAQRSHARADEHRHSVRQPAETDRTVGRNCVFQLLGPVRHRQGKPPVTRDCVGEGR